MTPTDVGTKLSKVILNNTHAIILQLSEIHRNDKNGVQCVPIDDVGSLLPYRVTL